MKYVEGQTLARYIPSKSLLDKLRLTQRIAESLDFAHARGFIHRDLKPENIMIGAFGEVLVMDWGLAKFDTADPEPTENEIAGPLHTSPRVTGRGSIIRTPGYMSPEQERGDTQLAFVVAHLQHGYYFQIMLPGGMVGLIVGYATQRYGTLLASQRV